MRILPEAVTGEPTAAVMVVDCVRRRASLGWLAAGRQQEGRGGKRE